MPQNSNNGFSRYMSNGRNGPNGDPSVVPQALMGQMIPLPFDGSVIPASPSDAQRSGPVPRSTLASTSASANPETQRMMLEEQLFPLVKRLEHENAGKVTSMLLKMDQTEVLHLIESPDALKKKVVEALDVLCFATTTGSNLGDQLGSLNSE